MAAVLAWRAPLVVVLVYVYLCLVKGEEKLKIVSHYSIVTTNRVQQPSTHDISLNDVKKGKTLRPIFKPTSAESVKDDPVLNIKKSNIRSPNVKSKPTVIKLNMTSFRRISDEDLERKERPDTFSRSIVSDSSVDQRVLSGSLRPSDVNDEFPKGSTSSKQKSFQYVKELNASVNQNSERNISYLCSEFYDGEEFYIKSPNYPFNYPALTSCRYTIKKVTGNCGIRLTILQFDLPFSSHGTNMSFNTFHNQTQHFCKDDRLVVDGHVLCGRFRRGTEGLYRFSTSVFSIEFQSGNGFGASGFLLKGKQTKNCSRANPFPIPQESSVQCNRIISRGTFSISSPGYPLNYPHDLECRYIVVRKNFNVCGLKIILRDFDLEETDYCMFDYIEVQGKRFCGNKKDHEPLYFTFEEEEISIRFKTDELVNGGGFKMLGQQVFCGDLRYFQSIDSPLSTNRSSTNKEAEFFWNLQDTGHALSRLAPLNSIGSKLNDSRQAKTLINVKERKTDFSERNNAEEDGPEKRDLSESSSPQDKVNLHPFTDDNPIVVHLNESIFPEAMRNKINEIFPIFNFSFNESNNGSGSKIEHFLTEGEGLPLKNDSTQDIFKDFERFPPNGLDSPPPVVDQFDDQINPNILDIGNKTLASCDEHHFTQVFIIQSPNYPNFYPHNVDCIYYVNRLTPDVCQLRITIEDLHIEKNFRDDGSCHSDYLDVAGYRLCGDIERKTVDMAFTSNIVTFQFHSDSQLHRNGFLITVEQVTQDCKKKLARSDPANCNATVDKSEFTLVSPGFPDPYFFNLWCVTTLLKESNDITSLQMDFVYFDVESSADCSKDYFLVDRKRYCGNQTGKSHVVPFPSEKIQFSFASNEIFSSGGFRVKIKQILNLAEDKSNCGGIVHSSTNEIILTSPFYPQGYLPSLHCSYIIKRKSSDICQLQVKILSFDVEASMDCRNDFLQFGPYNRICGKRRKNELRNYHFNSENFKIVFHTDSYISGGGYRIELRQYPCQGLAINNKFWRTDQPPILTSPNSHQQPGSEIYKPFGDIHCHSNPAKSLIEFLQGNHDNIPLKHSTTLFGATTAFPLLESQHGHFGNINLPESVPDSQVVEEYIASNLRPIYQFQFPRYRNTENLAINSRNCIHCKPYSRDGAEVVYGSPSQVSPITLETTSPRSFIIQSENEPKLVTNEHNHIPIKYDYPHFQKSTRDLQSDITFSPGPVPNVEALHSVKEIYSKWYPPIYELHSEIPADFKLRSLSPSSHVQVSKNTEFITSTNSSKFQVSLNPSNNSTFRQSNLQINKDFNFKNNVSPPATIVNTSFHSNIKFAPLKVQRNMGFRKAFPTLQPKRVSNSQPLSSNFDEPTILQLKTSNSSHFLQPVNNKFKNKTNIEVHSDFLISTVTLKPPNKFSSKAISSTRDLSLLFPGSLKLNYSHQGSFTKIPIRAGINLPSANSETQFQKSFNSSFHKPPSLSKYSNSIPTQLSEFSKKLGFNISNITPHSEFKNQSEFISVLPNQTFRNLGFNPLTSARPVEIFKNLKKFNPSTLTRLDNIFKNLRFNPSTLAHPVEISGNLGINTTPMMALSNSATSTKLDSKSKMNVSDSELTSSNVNAIYHIPSSIRTISNVTFGNKMGLPVYADSLKLCNESIAFQHFEMTNPGYPSTYDVDIHCIYSVKRLSKLHCALAFQLRELYIPSEKSCRRAFLSIAGRRLCGTQVNPISVIIPFSPETPISIEYRSDKLVTGNKFSLVMQQIPCTDSPHFTQNVVTQQNKFAQPPKFIQPPKIVQPPKNTQPPKITQPLKRLPHPPKIVPSQKNVRQLPIQSSSTNVSLDPQKLYQHSRDVLSVIKSPHVKHLVAPPQRNKVSFHNEPTNLSKPLKSRKPSGGRRHVFFPWLGVKHGKKVPYMSGKELVQRQKLKQNQNKKVKYRYAI